MLNILQRNVIRGLLDEGMDPQEIADYLGRLNDLDPLEVITIRSAAYDILNEDLVDAPELAAGQPALTLVTGGAA